MSRLDEILETIRPIDQAMCCAARVKWDEVGKPLRSLGKLEDMVIKLAGVTGELTPKVDKKAVLIFCADNGVVEEGVTQTGSEVTAIVSENFTKGIATINSFGVYEYFYTITYLAIVIMLSFMLYNHFYEFINQPNNMQKCNCNNETKTILIKYKIYSET